MMETLPISTLRVSEIYEVIDKVTSMDAKAGAGVMRSYLVAVDWSSPDKADPEVRRVLGQLEGLTTEFDEGHLDASEYAAELRSLLPAAS